jgi:hypothetical protein
VDTGAGADSAKVIQGVESGKKITKETIESIERRGSEFAEAYSQAPATKQKYDMQFRNFVEWVCQMHRDSTNADTVCRHLNVRSLDDPVMRNSSVDEVGVFDYQFCVKYLRLYLSHRATLPKGI